MRLLHTETLEFQEFFDSQTPVYAILSHRWTGNEVSFEEFYQRKEQDGQSFSKIKDCCRFAMEDGYEWVWIDTCCIDKRSSAELTEAINSMYAWYQNSGVCYAYLVDVLMVMDEYGNWHESRKQFHRSAWFTRAWTLQELLAPDVVIFLDSVWDIIGYRGGNKHASSLDREISLATGIDEANLVNAGKFACVARKMSWLSRRETTRTEDMAYCMLGLCGVNMPLLYGEGENAFRRLQSEIIKVSDDESIFAWFCDRNGDAMPKLSVSGLLAPSPGNFAKSRKINRSLPRSGTRPYSLTNKGLEYHMPRHIDDLGKLYGDGDTLTLLLYCRVGGHYLFLDDDPAVAIRLVFQFGRWWREWPQDGQPMASNRTEWDEASRVGRPFETIYIEA
ncbi:MAG: hypothetical protein Q9208_004241 [Pyrenodesmia sp. 3 TL-2023]